MFIMDIGKFYDTAKNYAEKIKEERPGFVWDSYSAICLIITENDEIFTGVTGLKISSGNVVTVSAENNTVMMMIAENTLKAKQMIVISLEDLRILKPSADCLNLLLRVDSVNEKCEVVVSEETSVCISDFLSDIYDINESDDDGESIEEVEMLAAEETVQSDNASISYEPDDCVDNVVIDESNPFYEPPVDKSKGEEPEIKVLYEQPGGSYNADDKADDNVEKSAEEMLKDAKKKKKSAKRFNSFFKRGYKD